MSKKRIVLDIETGEILNELESGDRIVKKSSVEYLKTTVDMVEFNDCKFMKLQQSFIDEIKGFNSSEVIMCLYLMSWTKYGTGLISHSNGKIMRSSDMAGEIGIDVRNVQRILKSLCDKEIICREKVGKGYAYYMNPFVCVKGSRVDRWLVKRFENSKFNKSK